MLAVVIAMVPLVQTHSWQPSPHVQVVPSAWIVPLSLQIATEASLGQWMSVVPTRPFQQLHVLQPSLHVQSVPLT